MRIPSCLSRLSLPVLTAMMVSAGCSHGQHHEWSYIKGNLTPELAGLSETKLDQQRDLAVVNNTSWRAFSDDWGRVWLTDQPTLLTPYPTVNTGGNPQ